MKPLVLSGFFLRELFQSDVRDGKAAEYSCQSQSSSGFSTSWRFPCFFSRASTAKALSEASFSIASIFSARQPSAFMRTSNTRRGEGENASGAEIVREPFRAIREPSSCGIVDGRATFKNTLTFPDRLKTFADELKAKAAELRPGPERDSLLRRARQADVASHIDEWANSPGLQPPK